MDAELKQKLADFVQQATVIVQEQHEKIAEQAAEIEQLKALQKTASPIPAEHVRSTVNTLIGAGLFYEVDREKAIQGFTESPEFTLSCLDKLAELKNVRQIEVPTLGAPAETSGVPADKGRDSEDAWQKSTDELSRLAGIQ